MEPLNMPPSINDQSKKAAIISYITIIGWLIAYFAFYQKDKSTFAGLHLRQTLLLYIIGFGLGTIERNAIWPYSFAALVSAVVGIFLFIAWLIGILGAIRGEEKLMPIIGKWAQQWFSSI